MKNMKNKFAFIAAIIAFCATMMMSACSKKFDEPPVQTTTLAELGIKANVTIDGFKTLTYVGSGAFYPITDSFVITGLVTANDKSGNLYKQIFIQDSTGGIEVDIENTGLYNAFPIGREVAVSCKGLYVTNYNGMQIICSKTTQNGSPAKIGIATNLISNYIKTGAIDSVHPIVVTINQLNTKLQGSLIKLEDFEIPFPDVIFSTYSDSSVNKNTVNVNIVNCSGQTTIIRTSAYANFASQPVPTGHGSVTAIYTVYSTTNQLIIRDTSDVQFRGTRCDGSSGNPPIRLRNIKDIRADTINLIPTYDYIEGTIVSNSANEASTLNYRIQGDDGYGIQLRFTSTSNKNWSLGDRVRVFVGNQKVSPYKGDLQINYVAGAITIGSGSVTPRVATIADIIASGTDWASTVVKINNVTITPGTVASSGTNYTITDATGSIVTYIRTNLGYTPPATATSITGYVSFFYTTPQLTLRKASDVQ